MEHMTHYAIGSSTPHRPGVFGAALSLPGPTVLALQPVEAFCSLALHLAFLSQPPQPLGLAPIIPQHGRLLPSLSQAFGDCAYLLEPVPAFWSLFVALGACTSFVEPGPLTCYPCLRLIEVLRDFGAYAMDLVRVRDVAVCGAPGRE
ncbi:hypothetical protein FIBSPDRAFT_959419 [Athelia psychrophila]|uniref:Uncharacterized protein n=1 Tax=Athelia psychrophila TaxID=1759441 RepID=A0A166DHA4_9AGAM|nr:hypothetical protein FIBSPDRAFT_959419 [Fibularhizoctonia sp. CBS 109695]